MTANLVVVVLPMEERLFEEDHAGQHAAKTPHVQTVVIHLRVGATNEELVLSERKSTYGMCVVPYLIVHQKLRAFEIAGGDPDVVFLSRMVKFSQAPVDEAQLFDIKKNWLFVVFCCTNLKNVSAVKKLYV